MNRSETSPPTQLRDSILRLRDVLDYGRQSARRAHDSGTPGRQIAQRLADVFDHVVLEVWNEATAAYRDPGHRWHRALGDLVLVAHGGYGRCDLSPYSDADMMLLSTRRSEPLATEILKTLVADLGDIGVDPSLSLRGRSEACRLAWTDPKVYTSLAESRYLTGSLSLYRRFFERFRGGSIRRRNKLIGLIHRVRREERRKWGGTSYLLRPNVKRSHGGLRDIQTIRWVGFAQHGEPDLVRLVKFGLVPEEDFRLLRRAYDFFIRVRHELHFRSGKAADVLDRSIQVDIADAWGYAAAEGRLPVESFMSEYFENAANVRYAAGYCFDESRWRSSVAYLYEKASAKMIAPDVWMGRRHVWVQRQAQDSFGQSLPKVLQLMSLANHHNRRIDHPTWRAIRNAIRHNTIAAGTDDGSVSAALTAEQPTVDHSSVDHSSVDHHPKSIEPLDDETIEAFRDLLSRPTRLASLLRRMHDLRLIEQILPSFARIRGLLQFNAYHKYTVDAHSIGAVDAATDLEQEENGFGRRYGRIDRLWLLHLTLLIHDIGKGGTEDHCIVGSRIAHDIADRLRMSDDDRELMAWLVRNHLIVNVIAFRHNLNDPEIVLEFAKNVGSIPRLEWLIVHTYADLTAVGPDVASDWKLNLIEDLYRRTRDYFDSGSLPGSPDNPELGRRRERLLATIDAAPLDDDVRRRCRSAAATLPLSILSRGDADSLADVLIVSQGSQIGAPTRCLTHIDGGVVRFTVLHRHDLRSIGTFARMAGVFAAAGVSIGRAQLEQFGDDSWNDFWVVMDQDGPMLETRIGEVRRQIETYMDDMDRPLPPPRRVWRAARKDNENVLPTKVVMDNQTIDAYTIVSIFAYDRPGLLHDVAAALAGENLVLNFAKIDTHLDQVVDVFYVNHADGTRLTDRNQQSSIREAILRVINEES